MSDINWRPYPDQVPDNDEDGPKEIPVLVQYKFSDVGTEHVAFAFYMRDQLPDPDGFPEGFYADGDLILDTYEVIETPLRWAYLE